MQLFKIVYERAELHVTHTFTPKGTGIEEVGLDNLSIPPMAFNIFKAQELLRNEQQLHSATYTYKAVPIKEGEHVLLYREH